MPQDFNVEEKKREEKKQEEKQQEEKKQEDHSAENANSEIKDLYDCVKTCIIEHLNTGMNIEEASTSFNVAKGQMRTWLKRLCNENLIRCDKGIYSKL